MSQVRAGSAYVELLTKDAAFVKGLRSAQKRLQSFGQSTRLLGTKLMGLGTAAAAPLGGSVAIFSNFDDAMRGVAAITAGDGNAASNRCAIPPRSLVQRRATLRAKLHR